MTIVVLAIRHKMRLSSARVTRSQLVVCDPPSHPTVEDVVDTFEHGLLHRRLLVERAIVADDPAREPGDIRELQFLSEVGVHLDAADASLTSKETRVD